jgi:predicted RNase H-like HicB family nuclease
MFSLTGIIIQDGQGYSALCPELDVASQGESLEEARAMLLEATTLYMESAIEDGLPIMRPVPIAEDPRNTDPGSIVELFPFRVDVAVHAYA